MNRVVSIIMPIYLAGRQLYKSVGSLTSQTYENIEILLVNDCSPDNSLEICKELAKQDSRIKVIDKVKNEGQELARWTGLEQATGSYVMFIDHDDAYLPNAVECLLKTLTENDVDIVYGGMTRRIGFLYRKDYLVPTCAVNKLIEGQLKEEFLCSWYGVNILPVTMWANIFKKSLFFPRPQHTSFKLGEDLTMSLQLYLRAKRVYALHKSFYIYNWGGITSKFQPTLLESAKGLYNFRKKLIQGLKSEAILTHYMNVEMMNFMATHVKSLITLDRRDSGWYVRHIKALEKHEEDSFWDCLDPLTTSEYAEDNQRSLIIKKQFAAYYKLKLAEQKKPINVAKRMSRRILERILRLYYK